MTTSTLAPKAAAPRTLKIAVTLGGFRFTPEQLKPDGTRKRSPELVLDTVHEGTDGAEELFAFLTHVRGPLEIHVTPPEETDLQTWRGVGTLGTVKLDLSGEPAVRFPIRIETELVASIEDLIQLRLDMTERGESSAILELEAIQPDLDFEGGEGAQ